MDIDNTIPSTGAVNERLKFKPPKQKWMDVVYVNDDIMITIDNNDQYTIRTKLYQYWNPASDSGWTYVDGV